MAEHTLLQAQVLLLTAEAQGQPQGRVLLTGLRPEVQGLQQEAPLAEVTPQAELQDHTVRTQEAGIAVTVDQVLLQEVVVVTQVLVEVQAAEATQEEVVVAQAQEVVEVLQVVQEDQDRT